MTEERKAPLTSAEKKRRFREKMKKKGLREIGVWIDPKYATVLREFGATLPRPTPKENPNQGKLFED